MGLAFNKEVYNKLNEKTNKIGISAKDIEIIIRNFKEKF